MTTDNSVLQSENEDVQSSFDISKYLSLFWSHKWWFVFSVIIVISVAYCVNRYAVPRSSSNLRIVVKSQGRSPEQVAGGLSLFSSDVNVDNEIALLCSNYFASLTLHRLQDFTTYYYKQFKFGSDKELYKTCPFMVVFDTLHTQLYSTKFFIEFKNQSQYEIWFENTNDHYNGNIWDTLVTDNFKFVVINRFDEFNADLNSPYYFINNQLSAMIRPFAAGLNASLISRQSSVLNLSMTGEVPEKYDDYLNELVKVYIEYGLAQKNAIAVKTIDFIDSQLDILSDSLNTSGADLEQFERVHGSELSSSSADIISEIKDIKKSLQDIDMRNNYYNHIISLSKDNNYDYSDLIDPEFIGVDDPVLSLYLTKIQDYKTNKIELNFSVKQNADIKQSKFIDYQIQDVVNNINSHAKNVIIMLSSKKKELSSRYNVLRAQMIELPVKERRKLNMTKRFDMNNEMYNFLIQRRTEAGITAASNQSSVEVLDYASPLTRNYLAPSGTFSIAKAVIVGLALPLLLILAIEFLNRTISETTEIEKVTGLSPLAVIGMNKRNTNVPTAKYPGSSVSEAFRNLRTALQYVRPDESNKIIVFTSAISGEGKTFNAVNTAIITAKNNKRVLLCGLDLRKPKLQEYFPEVSSSSGLSTYLIGNEELNSVIIPSGYNNLDIVLPGPVPPNPAELIESRRMEDFINTVKPLYDYIFLDSAPIGIVTDAALLNKFATCYIFVVRQNYSQKSVLKLFLDLKRTGLSHINIVFNGIKSSHGNYGYYGGKYGYGYGHGDYYDDEHQKSLKNRFFDFFKRRHNKS